MNSDFFGIYLRIEAVDKDFLAARKLDPSGNLYKAAERGACLSIYDDIDYHWQKMTNEMSGNEDLNNLLVINWFI